MSEKQGPSSAQQQQQAQLSATLAEQEKEKKEELKRLQRQKLSSVRESVGDAPITGAIGGSSSPFGAGSSRRQSPVSGFLAQARRIGGN